MIQNVVESKEDNTSKEDNNSKEDEKVGVVEFKDVPKGHWSEEAIHYLAKENILRDMEMDNLDLGIVLLVDKLRL